MSYVIRYGPEVPESVPVRPFRGYWMVILLVCVLAGFWLRRPVMEWTEISFGAFAEAVAAEEPFGEALEAFCRDVLEDA